MHPLELFVSGTQTDTQTHTACDTLASVLLGSELSLGEDGTSDAESFGCCCFFKFFFIIIIYFVAVHHYTSGVKGAKNTTFQSLFFYLTALTSKHRHRFFFFKEYLHGDIQWASVHGTSALPTELNSTWANIFGPDWNTYIYHGIVYWMDWALSLHHFLLQHRFDNIALPSCVF